MDVAANMRRLFGSWGGAFRQDVLVTGDADGPLGADGDQEARVTYMQAEERWVHQKRREGVPKVSGDAVEGGGQTLIVVRD